jgi:sodium/potassium-transporting ATPase subunit alpha
VVRNGEMITDFPARELVVGDLIEIKYGDKVPADVRIVQASGMQVNNRRLLGQPSQLTTILRWTTRL